MSNTAPVGVMDSGLGGLSVLRAIRARLPHENVIYAADSGNAPWGDRTPEFIAQRCEAMCSFLIGQGAKAVVLACNTATAVAAELLRSRFTVPVIGTEPAVKPAAQKSRAKKVGVIATTRTIQSRRYQSLLTRFAAGTEVFSLATPGLMECVECGAFNTESTRSLIAHYLKPMIREGIDTLVLGCTHYPFLDEALREVLGNSVEIIEPGPAIAAVTESRLRQINALNEEQAAGSLSFFIKNAPAHQKVLHTLCPDAGDAAELPV